MGKKKQSDKPVEKTTRKPSSGGKTTEELTKRHMKDKNDKITDEDIRSIRIDTSVNEDEPLDIPKEHPHDVDKDNKKATPWDIISE